MVNYLNISEKYAFEKPKFSFKLYNNIVVPNWVDFDWMPGPKRGMMETHFRLSKKVLVICSSSLNSSF